MENTGQDMTSRVEYSTVHNSAWKCSALKSRVMQCCEVRCNLGKSITEYITVKISAVHLLQCMLCALQFSVVKVYTAQNMCSAVWGSALQ